MSSASDCTDAGRRARRLDRNPVLLCVHQALMMALFPMAVLTVFQRDHLGLDMAQIMTVQAAFGLALVVLEFPSGYLADRIGYRATMILASVSAVLGWTVYSFAQGLAGVIGAELMLGASLSLISGTSSAILYESLEERDRSADFARWFGRTRFWAQLSEGSAALVAGLVFAFSVRLPFQLMVLVWLANLGVALALEEPRYAKHRPASAAAHVVRLVRFVAREAPRLRALFFVGVALGLSSFVPVWLVQLYATDAGVPASWLGPIWAVANYVVAIGSALSRRTSVALGAMGLLLACSGLIALGYFGMGLTYAWWGFVFYFAFNLSRGLSAPLIAHAEQAEIPSGDRASLVSLRSLLFRATFVVLGPTVGAAVDVHGQHPVLLVLGGGLVALSLLGCLLVARSRAQPRPSL
jgi:MFS family permease